MLVLVMVMATEHKLTFKLLSDSADGVVKVQLASWGAVVAVYRFSRVMRKEAERNLQSSGIYFLLGEKEGRSHLYVGQSSNVGKRLSQHVLDSNKDFWTETLVLTTAHQPHLNSAHLDYLENRFHAIAKEAGRRSMVNSTVPPIGPGVEDFRHVMEAFIAEAMLLLNLMGYHFLEKQAEVMEVKPQPAQKPALPVAAEKVPEMPEPPQRLAGDVACRPATPRAAKYNFYVMGLHDGDVLVYEDKDPAHRTEAVVCGPDKIQVNGEVMTPHALAKRIRQTNNVYAFAYLSWKGEKLCNIYNRVYHGAGQGAGAENPADLRYFTVAGADAVGRLTDDGGIVVLKGSRLCAETKKSCLAAAVLLRQEVGESLITQKDYFFKSLSGAAQFVGGCALNGKLCWLEIRKAPKLRKKKQ